MMSTEQFRALVTERVLEWAASRPTLPIAYENGPVIDEKTVGPIWLDLQLRFYGGNLVAMGERPLGRHSGTISAMVFHRIAAGTGDPDRICDELIELFRAKRIGRGLTQMPQRTVPTDFLGWYKTGLLVPFTLDS